MARRRRLAPFALTVAIATLTACSVSSDDYRRESESYLESDALAEEAGYRFSNAVCEEPSSQNEGTQFTCRATDNDGDEWLFVVEITGTREITVISGDVIG
jgi:hypothetical protein